MAQTTSLVFNGGVIPSPAPGTSGSGKAKLLKIGEITVTEHGVQVTKKVICDPDSITTVAPFMEVLTSAKLAELISANSILVLDDGTVQYLMADATVVVEDGTSVCTSVSFLGLSKENRAKVLYPCTRITDELTLHQVLEVGEPVETGFDLVKAYPEDTEAGTLIEKLEIEDTSEDPDWHSLLEIVQGDGKVAINEDNLCDTVDTIYNTLDNIIDTLDGMDFDSVPRAYLHSTLNQSAGDSVTTGTQINVFALTADLVGDCFEFEQTTTIDDTPFGYVWIEPGTYLINAAVTLQWVGNPRGTFIAKVGHVMGENFDFSQEQEIKRNTTKVVTIPNRMKLSVNITYDAGTPVMGFWIQSMQVVKLAGGMSQTNVSHNDTLVGRGSVADPLGVDEEKVAQSTLAGNLAPAFVPNSTNAKAGMQYVYDGELYMAKEDYIGPWDSSKFTRTPLSTLLFKHETLSPIWFNRDYVIRYNGEKVILPDSNPSFRIFPCSRFKATVSVTDVTTLRYVLFGRSGTSYTQLASVSYSCTDMTSIDVYCDAYSVLDNAGVLDNLSSYDAIAVAFAHTGGSISVTKIEVSSDVENSFYLKSEILDQMSDRPDIKSLSPVWFSRDYVIRHSGEKVVLPNNNPSFVVFPCSRFKVTAELINATRFTIYVVGWSSGSASVLIRKDFDVTGLSSIDVVFDVYKALEKAGVLDMLDNYDALAISFGAGGGGQMNITAISVSADIENSFCLESKILGQIESPTITDFAFTDFRNETDVRSKFSNINGTFGSSGFSITAGWSNALLHNKVVSFQDESFTINFTKSDASTIVYFGTRETQPIITGGYGSCVKVDFANHTIGLLTNNQFINDPSSISYKVSNSATDFSAWTKCILTIKRVDRLLSAKLVNYYTGESVEVTSTNLTNQFGADGNLYDTLLFASTKSVTVESIAVDIPTNVDVLFVGDSVSDGRNILVANSWTRKFGEYLGCKCCYAPRCGGRAGTLLRFLTDWLDYIKPKVVICSIGVNGGNSTSLFDNIYNLVTDKGILLVLNTIFNAANSFTNISESDWNTYNAYILSKNCKHIRFDIATSSNKVSPVWHSLDSHYTLTDSVHPDADGSILLFERAKLDAGDLKFLLQ